jgi:uncharacterized membrane protein YqgA involved in biofilm formation
MSTLIPAMTWTWLAADGWDLWMTIAFFSCLVMIGAFVYSLFWVVKTVDKQPRDRIMKRMKVNMLIILLVTVIAIKSIVEGDGLLGLMVAACVGLTVVEVWVLNRRIDKIDAEKTARQQIHEPPW